jgi:uncharacterized membrane protein YccF (DUF307 family)
MKSLANILWHFPFLGFLRAFGTALVAAVFIITIIGAPIGIGLLQLAKFYLSPFTKVMVNEKLLAKKPKKYEGTLGKILETGQKLWGTFGIIVKILYFPIGLFMAIVNIFMIAAEFVSLIGIPVALGEAKALSTWFSPVGKVCVSKAVADELEERKAKAEVDKKLG